MIASRLYIQDVDGNDIHDAYLNKTFDTSDRSDMKLGTSGSGEDLPASCRSRHRKQSFNEAAPQQKTERGAKCIRRSSCRPYSMHEM